MRERERERERESIYSKKSKRLLCPMKEGAWPNAFCVWLYAEVCLVMYDTVCEMVVTQKRVAVVAKYS